MRKMSKKLLTKFEKDGILTKLRKSGVDTSEDERPSEKLFKKVLKKVLTNAIGCGIIVRLCSEHGVGH